MLKTCGVSFLVNLGTEGSLSVASEGSSAGKETDLFGWFGPGDLLDSSIFLLLLLPAMREEDRRRGERGRERKQYPFEVVITC